MAQALLSALKRVDLKPIDCARFNLERFNLKRFTVRHFRSTRMDFSWVRIEIALLVGAVIMAG